MGKKKHLTALISVMVFAIFALLFYLSSRTDPWVPITPEALEESTGTSQGSQSDISEFALTVSENSEGPFYLVGEVKHPGIYIVESGDYLYEVVELAGGLTDQADSEHINLASTVTPGGMFRIPSIHDEPGSVHSAQESPEHKTGGEDASTKLLGINSASATELIALPGIGPSTAEAIVSLRETLGGFDILEDLMLVAGIKEKRFEQIKQYIYLD